MSVSRIDRREFTGLCAALGAGGTLFPGVPWARIEQEPETHDALRDVDVVVTPTLGGNQLLITNLTGHPAIVLPNGFRENGTPTSISFIGRLFGEGAMPAVARAYHDATDRHLRRPPLFA